MKSLPTYWERVLNECNMALARRELAEFFQMANRSAEVEGKQAFFEKELVAGWVRFADDPCVETASAFLKGLPADAAQMILRFFEGSCPGGHLHRSGIKTAMSF